MARPRKNEHIKQSLLEVGLETLLTQGYHGTGIKAVLDKLGVPKGSFYHYFKSKEAFAAEVINYYADDLNNKLHSQLSHQKLSGLNGLKAAFRLLVDEYKTGAQGCVLGALASEIADTSETCRLAIHKEMNNWLTLIEALIKQGQAEQEIRTDLTSELLAKMIMNCWEGAVLRMKIEAQTDPAEEAVEQMFEAILRQPK